VSSFSLRGSASSSEALSQCFGSDPATPAQTPRQGSDENGSSPYDSSVRPQRGSRSVGVRAPRTTRPPPVIGGILIVVAAPRTFHTGNLLEQFRVPRGAEALFLRKCCRRKRPFCPGRPSHPVHRAPGRANPPPGRRKSTPAAESWMIRHEVNFFFQRQPVPAGRQYVRRRPIWGPGRIIPPALKPLATSRHHRPNPPTHSTTAASACSASHLDQRRLP